MPGNNDGRRDAVFVRKSTQQQDESAQVANITAMLKERGVYVPPDRWFFGTVSRRNVRSNEAFNRLLQLVEADQVGTIYIESQDRWGTIDRAELFEYIKLFRKHKTHLLDLRTGLDLTDPDVVIELLTFLGGVKNEKELRDLAYRSLRSRVNNFPATGSWPTGVHPFGYGKECRGPDGAVKWVWHPVDRFLGQIWYPGPDGPVPGPANVRIPRKERGDIIRLVPNRDQKAVRAVQMIFDLYVRFALSRRQIAVRLNAEGLTLNGRPFIHSDITCILSNPAYCGDTFFGRTRPGKFCTFADGKIIELKQPLDDQKRDLSECLVVPDTHEPLVDRETWQKAQEKLAAERKRKSYAPRNDKYYLKQLLVCGHCGQPMAGRTENGTVVYVCRTYLKGRQNGVPSTCGYHRIKHDDAEKLLLEKIKELGLRLDDDGGKSVRDSLEQQLARLGHEDDEARLQWWSWLEQGIRDLTKYLKQTYDLDQRDLARLQKAARRLYEWGVLGTRPRPELPLTIRELRDAMRQAEQTAVERARQQLEKLRAEHRRLTLQWTKATEQMQTVLREEIEKLEQAIRFWEPRTVPLSQRVAELRASEQRRAAERRQLLADWPRMQNRERGEALRRLFDSVTLFWSREFHPSEEKPSRPRRTNRPGRFSYSLERDRIKWGIANYDLEYASCSSLQIVSVLKA